MAKADKIAKPQIGSAVFWATLSLNMLALALPLTILQIFDRVIPYSSMSTLAYLALGLIVVVVLETLLRIARIILLGAKSETYQMRLISRFVDKTLNADAEKYAKTTSAEHLERFAAIDQMRDFHAGQGRLTSLEMPFAALFIAMIGLIGGWLVLVPIVGVILLVYFTKSLVRLQEPVFEERKSLDARRYSFLIEILSQINTIKLNTMEKQMMRRFEMMQTKTVQTSERMILYSGLSQSFGAVYAQTALAAMGLFGGFLVIKDQIGIAELAACMLLNGRSIQPFVKMLGVWAQSEGIAASERKLRAAMEVEQVPIDSAANRAPENWDIVLNSLTVLPPVEGQKTNKVLDGIIPAGACITVSGPDSAGKSALLRVLFGHSTPHLGQVLIDGRPVTKSWPQRGADGIVFIGRKTAPFSGTVLQNISAFGDGERIKRALSIAEDLGLEDIVHRLPFGYNTVLDEGGSFALDLSSLKKICLVRALVLRPKLLLMNDPTHSLDRQARLKFAAFIENQQTEGMTTVLVTEDEHLRAIADDQIDLAGRTFKAWERDKLDDAAVLQPGAVA